MIKWRNRARSRDWSPLSADDIKPLASRSSSRSANCKSSFTNGLLFFQSYKYNNSIIVLDDIKRIFNLKKKLTVLFKRCRALTRSSVSVELHMASYMRRISRRYSISTVSTSTTAPVEDFHTLGCDICIRNRNRNRQKTKKTNERDKKSDDAPSRLRLRTDRIIKCVSYRCVGV